MGVRVNFSGVEPQSEPGSGPVAEGTYLVLVDEAKESTARTGTRGINMTLKILGGDFEGRKLWDDLWITQAALPYALHRLQCLGTPVPQGEFDLTPQMLTGRRAKVTVKHREYEGKLQVRIVAWEPADAQTGGPDPLAAARAADPDVPF